MKFTFYKMQALGNDFVMIDQSQFASDILFYDSFFKCICNRNFGIGCDLVVLYRIDNNQNIITTSFFNSDGSRAEICGNAIRCLGLLMNKSKNAITCRVKTENGIFSVNAYNNKKISVVCEKAKTDNVAIGLRDDIEDSNDLSKEEELQHILRGLDVQRISSISVGNPHLLVFLNNIPDSNTIKNIGSKLENSSLFKNKINVCFAKILSDFEIDLCVFERGCGLTLACGSGASATAIVAYKNRLLKSNNITVYQKGGNLEIEIKQDGSFKQTGVAEIVFRGISETLITTDMVSFTENKTSNSTEKLNNDHISIYTDGACSGNPGLGGWGALIIYSDGDEKELSGYEENTTNNRMELIAAIMSLEQLESHISSVKIFTDSKYVKDGITKWINNWIKNNWKTADNKPVKNKELWKRLLDISIKYKISWNWVKGHDGDINNERADFLAKTAIKNSK